MANNNGNVWKDIPGLPSISAQQLDGPISKAQKRYNKVAKTLTPISSEINKGQRMTGDVNAAGANSIRQFAGSPKKR